MREWFVIALGGALGASMRHGISVVSVSTGFSWPPAATLLANVIGCLAIGYVYSWSTQLDTHNHWLTIGVRVGLLGGLTTFSSFALDLVKAYFEGRHLETLGLLVAHCLLGCVAVIIGVYLAGGPPASTATRVEGLQSDSAANVIDQSP